MRMLRLLWHWVAWFVEGERKDDPRKRRRMMGANRDDSGQGLGGGGF